MELPRIIPGDKVYHPSAGYGMPIDLPYDIYGEPVYLVWYTDCKKVIATRLAALDFIERLDYDVECARCGKLTRFYFSICCHCCCTR